MAAWLPAYDEYCEYHEDSQFMEITYINYNIYIYLYIPNRVFFVILKLL